MLARRSALIGAGLLGTRFLVLSRSARALSSRDQEPAAFRVPPGACDTHVHVIGPPAQFPMSVHRDYTPSPATAPELLEMMASLGLERVVIVTPTIYGEDNSATLDAIRQVGPARARGVAIVGLGVPPQRCDALKAGGIAGLRVLISGGRAFDAVKAAKSLQFRFEFAEEQDWHLDIEAPPDAIAALAKPLAASPVPVVLDTFGWVDSTRQGGFKEILSLVESGAAYVKLAEPYRISKRGPDYPDLAPVARALVAANPERVLWGSGWPHVDSSAVPGRRATDPAPNLPIKTSNMLALLGRWVGDARTRDQILVSNPARLYGF